MQTRVSHASCHLFCGFNPFLGGEPTIYFCKGEKMRDAKTFFAFFPFSVIFCVPSKNGDESLEFQKRGCLVHIHLQQKLSERSF